MNTILQLIKHYNSNNVNHYLFIYFQTYSTTEVSKKDRPLSTASIGLSTYQITLEEVLTWLLGAEDRLANMPDIENSTESVKLQFHELEVCRL